MAFLLESHVAVNLRCFLCDHDLHETNGNAPPSPVVCIYSPRQGMKIDGSKSDLTASLSSGAGVYYIDMNASGARKRFQSHHSGSGSTEGCGHCSREKSVFIAHWDCSKIVRNSAGMSSGSLQEFALRTVPLAPRRAELHAPLSLFDLVDSINRETSLGRLIVHVVEWLPPELHLRIMREVQLDATSFQHYGKLDEGQHRALLSASSVLFTRLATVQVSTIPRLRSGFEEEGAHVPGLDLDHIHTMYIRPVDIFGAAYIAQIGFSTGQDALPSIQVRSEELRGVRFALGRFGLRGLRLLYADGSASIWLGSTSGCWYGNVPGKSIRDIRIVMDGPRVARIGVPGPRFLDPRIYTTLLDREIDAPPGELLPFLSNLDTRKPFFSPPRYYTDTRPSKFARYLPLRFGPDYTTGLTMFWSGGVLRGISSYGPNDETATLGLCTGEAVHFPLASGEYFTSFWIRIGYARPPLVGPFLLTFGTSTGRSAHFGPQVMMRPWITDGMLRHRWKAISSWAGPALITGVLVEALAEWHPGGYRGFGVVQEPMESSGDEDALVRPTVPDITVVSPDPEDYFDFQETLLSTGSLLDVKGIGVRRKGIRCVGVRITHGAGLDDYLGSWDPMDTSSMSTVYETSQHGPLTCLFFSVHLKEEDRKPIIVDVIANDPSNSHIASEKTKTLKVIPIEEAGLMTDDSLPDDFLVEFRCGHPDKMLAWFHDERTTEARCFIPGDQNPIGRNFDVDDLYALAWEPPIDEHRMWLGQWLG